MLECILNYLGITMFMMFFFNPTNLKSYHIHLTASLSLSYLILFPSHLSKLKEYIYHLRFWFLLYLILDFQVDPVISLLHFIAFLVITYHHDYETTNEYFQNQVNQNKAKDSQSNLNPNFEDRKSVV